MTRSLSIYPLWIIAFIAGLFPVNSWQLGCLLVSVTGLIFWAVISLYKTHQNLCCPKTWVLGAVGLFWLLAFASIFWSEAPFVSLMGFCIFTALPMTILIGICCPQNFPLEKIKTILFGILSLLGVWAMIQFFVFNDVIDGRARHPLANPNALAVIFNIGFFLALGSFKKSEDKLALITTILCAGGLMMTGSRGALLAALPALLFFAVFGRAFIKQNAKQIGLVLCAGAVFFALTSVGTKTNETIAARTVKTLSGAAPDLSGNRFEIWEGVAGVIKGHGLTGTGIGTFFLYYDEHRSLNEKNGASHAHSDPLQFWAEMGVAGICLFYTILVLTLMRLVAALKKIKSEMPERIKIIAPFASLLALAVHAHYSFPLYNLSVLFLTGFVFVVFFAETQKFLNTSLVKISGFLKSDFLGAILIVPLICLWMVFSLYVSSEHFVNRARTAMFEGRLEDMAKNLETAGRLAFNANARAYLLAVNVPLGLLEQKEVPLSAEQRKGLYEEANGYLARAKRFYPRGPSVYYYQARANELIGENYDQAEALYQKTLALDPMHLGARIALTDHYKKAGENERAYEVLTEGLVYDYRAPITPRYLGRVMGESLQRGDIQTQKKAGILLKRYYALLSNTKARSLSGPLGKIFGNEKRDEDASGFVAPPL